MQDFIVFLIVGGAAAYLGRHWWKTARTGSCGGCSGACGKPAAKPAQQQLVQIDLNGSSFRKGQ